MCFFVVCCSCFLVVFGFCFVVFVLGVVFVDVAIFGCFVGVFVFCFVGGFLVFRSVFDVVFWCLGFFLCCFEVLC